MSCDLSFIELLKKVNNALPKLGFDPNSWGKTLKVEDDTIQKMGDRINNFNAKTFKFDRTNINNNLANVEFQTVQDVIDFVDDMNIAGGSGSIQSNPFTDILPTADGKFYVNNLATHYTAKGTTGETYDVILPDIEGNKTIYLTGGTETTTYNWKKVDGTLITTTTGKLGWIGCQLQQNEWFVFQNINADLLASAESSINSTKNTAEAEINSIKNTAISEMGTLKSETQTFRNESESFASMAENAKGIYIDTDTGLGATVDGEYFYVVIDDELILYKNNAGVAEETTIKAGGNSGETSLTAKDTNLLKNTKGFIDTEVKASNFLFYVGSDENSNIKNSNTAFYKTTQKIKDSGEQCAIQLATKGESAGFVPQMYFYISKDELIDLGVVPSSTTTISLKLGIMKELCEGQLHSSYGQFYVALRYGNESDSYKIQANDMYFNVSGEVPYGYLGYGDHTLDHPAEEIDVDYKKVQIHRGIKVLDTYDGKDFNGLIIGANAYQDPYNEAHTGIKFAIGDFALVSGNEIKNKPYLNRVDYPKIEKEYLSKKVQDDLQEYNSNLKNTVTLQNSDFHVIIGDSYSASHFSMKDKAYISRLNELTDFRIENYSQSGKDMAEIAHYILDKNDISSKIYNGIHISEYGAKKAFILFYTNDRYYYQNDLNLLKDNIKKVIFAVRSIGIEPVLCTEHRPMLPNEYNTYKTTAEELHVQFVDLIKDSKKFIHDQQENQNFWAGMHPGVRTNNVFLPALLNELSTRPERGIKIFRPRNNNAISDLLYTTTIERAKKWKEISVAHDALQPDYAPYYDNLTTIAYSDIVSSEYIKLQNDETIEFNNFALIEFILPCIENNKIVIDVGISDAEKVYVKKVKTNYINYADVNTKTFLIEVENFPNADVIGSTYEMYGVTKTAEDFVEYNGKKYVIFTGYYMNPTVTYGSVTVTKVSGDSTVDSFEGIRGVFGSRKNYYETRKIEHEWIEHTIVSGKIIVENVDYFIDYDKISIVVEKNGLFNLKAPMLTFYGTYKVKDNTKTTKIIPYFPNKILKDVSTATLTNCEIIDPFDGSLLNDMISTKIVKINSSSKIEDNIDITGHTGRIYVEVWARVTPPVFIPSSSENAEAEYQTAPITSDTFDYRRVKFSIGTEPPINAPSDTLYTHIEKYIGLGWEKIDALLYYPKDVNSVKIIIETESIQSVEVAQICAYK